MENFIFHTELKNKLQKIIEKTDATSKFKVLCFFGSFGIGKTTFAKYLGDILAKETIDYDCANVSQIGILQDIEERYRYVSLDNFENDKKFEKCFILDEFQSLTKRNKASFKKPLVDFTSSGRVLFIICVNADVKSLETILTGPIKSRCLTVDFDIKKQHYKEIASIVKERFPILDENYILETLPDFRQIAMNADFMS